MTTAGIFNDDSSTWRDFGKFIDIYMNTPHDPFGGSFDGTDSGSNYPTQNTADATEQCRWVEEIARFYQKFRVYKCRITMKIRNLSTSKQDTGTFPLVVYFDDHQSEENQDTRVFTSIKQLKDWHKPHAWIPSGGTKTLSYEFTVNRVEHQNKLLHKIDQDYVGTSDMSSTITQPTKLPHVVVGFINPLNTNSASLMTDNNVQVETWVSYKTLWYDRGENAQQLIVTGKLY